MLSERQFPLGDPVNGSPHSVCASLPRLADVIGYEEKDPAVLETFAAGYPRFFRNPLLRELQRQWRSAGRLPGEDPLLPTRGAAVDLLRFLGRGAEEPSKLPGAWTVALQTPTERSEASAFLQHTGASLSSREAEAILAAETGLSPFPETRAPGTAAEHASRIREALHKVYGTVSPEDIRLFRSGMNAFYAGFRALQAVQRERGRDLWIQLGWLYVDTIRILKRFSFPGQPPRTVLRMEDPADLEEVLRVHGHRVAGIVTEVPTNPMVLTPDVPRLRELADRYGAGLVLDPTLVSPHNVNVLPYADLHINSLTKYAAVEADVMMGALALRPGSAFYDELRQRVDLFGQPPGEGDLARMAYQIPGYGKAIRRINATAVKVAEFLRNHPGVDELWWPGRQPGAGNYSRLRHHEAGPGAILSFTCRKPMPEVYDELRFVKSPSFGARFTMVCPFLYLAHYDLVKTRHGRRQLEADGLPPDLLRLSIGLEEPEAILAELDRCLAP